MVMPDETDVIGNATLDPSETVTVNTRSSAVAAAETAVAPKLPPSGVKTVAPATAHAMAAILLRRPLRFDLRDGAGASGTCLNVSVDMVLVTTSEVTLNYRTMCEMNF